MAGSSQFSQLVVGYFHQDLFDIYADEFEAIDDFIAADRAGSADLPAEIEQFLHDHTDETELQVALTQLGAEILPPDGLTYREWLTQIADHVRAATSGGASATD